MLNGWTVNKSKANQNFSLCFKMHCKCKSHNQTRMESVTMTKAEQIYKNTRYECRKHIQAWGFEGVGFNGLITEECTPTRTLNDITKILERAQRNLEIDKKLNILTEIEYQKEHDILSMIEITLNNKRRSNEKFQQELREIGKGY